MNLDDAIKMMSLAKRDEERSCPNCNNCYICATYKQLAKVLCAFEGKHAVKQDVVPEIVLQTFGRKCRDYSCMGNEA